MGLGYGIIGGRGAGDLADHKNEKKTKWHSPIYRGLQLDLRGNPLQFEDNMSLSEEALEIDAVIIKDANVQVEKDIGEIFKGYNICEFKSVTDYFSISDYAKVIGYASLYSALKGADMTDITITIVVTKYPQKLVKYLSQKRNIQVQDRGNGIHYVIGDIYPVQILETKKLSDDNLFLKNLRSNLTNVEMKKMLQALEEAGVVDKRDVYLACIIDSNLEVFREVMNMVPELKERFLEMAEEDGWLDERDIEKAKAMAKKLLRFGDSVEKVAEVTELPLDTVRTLA